MGIGCDDDKAFPLGSFVVIKRGKRAGLVCIVVGKDENPEKGGRILIADGRRISAGRPKRKSLRHVEMTGSVSTEVAQRLAQGKSIDDGWLAQIISRLTESEFTTYS